MTFLVIENFTQNSELWDLQVALHHENVGHGPAGPDVHTQVALRERRVHLHRHPSVATRRRNDRRNSQSRHQRKRSSFGAEPLPLFI